MGGKNADLVKARGVGWQFISYGISRMEICKNCVQKFGCARSSRKVSASGGRGKSAQHLRARISMWSFADIDGVDGNIALQGRVDRVVERTHADRIRAIGKQDQNLPRVNLAPPRQHARCKENAANQRVLSAFEH